MNEHLNKPIEVEKLYETLLKYISKKSDTSKTIAMIDEIKIPKFQYIDIEKGLKYLDGNRKLYLKILNRFQNDYTNFKIDLLNKKDFTRVIHTLKGLSANIGAKHLHLKVQELDKTQDKTLIDAVYTELEKVLEDLKLLQTVDKIEQKELLTLSSEKRNFFLNQLKEFAIKSRTNKCKSIIKEIQMYQLNDADTKLFNQVKELVNHYKCKDVLLLL
jgi:HPt (histidine-containing phosphotransfer) domain-containing protein